MQHATISASLRPPSAIAVRSRQRAARARPAPASRCRTASSVLPGMRPAQSCSHNGNNCVAARAGPALRRQRTERGGMSLIAAALGRIAAPERRTIGVACGAHILHDGYTDLLYVLLPLWQAEFGLGYAEVGALRGVYSGCMAALQVPAGLIAERIGGPLLLGIGTALAGVGFLVAGASTGFGLLVLALMVGGAGSSVQHPIAANLVAQAFSGPRSRNALATYNFSGDLGKMAFPAATAGLVALMPWRSATVMLGVAALAGAAAILAVRGLPARTPPDGAS